jgi:SNF2 family DNA or RNA helicase
MMSLYTKQEGIGFSKSEFPIMAEIVAYYRNKRTVTPSMMRTIKRTVKRYLPLLTLEAPRPKRRTNPTNGNAQPVIVEQINSSKKLKLTCDNGFANQLKKINGRKYIPKNGYWSIPMSLKNVERLIDAGAELGPRLRNWYENINTQPDENTTVQYNKLKRELRSYQEFGVRFIEAKNGRCLVADDMGLGKTTEILAWLDSRPDAWPVLIVCPSSVKYNWGREIQKCLGKIRTQFLSGKKVKDALTG